MIFIKFTAPSTKIMLKGVRNRTKAFIKKSNYVRLDNHFGFDNLKLQVLSYLISVLNSANLFFQHPWIHFDVSIRYEYL